MLNDDVFSSEVDFSHPQRERRRPSPKSFVVEVGRWGVTAAAVLTLHLAPVTASNVKIVPNVILRAQPSAELTPEVVALYREAAAEDRELAELGMTDYHVLVRASDET